MNNKWSSLGYKVRRVLFDLGDPEVRRVVFLVTFTTLSGVATVAALIFINNVPLKCFSAFVCFAIFLVSLAESIAQVDYLRMTALKRTIRWARRYGWIIRGFGY